MIFFLVVYFENNNPIAYRKSFRTDQKKKESALEYLQLHKMLLLVNSEQCILFFLILFYGRATHQCLLTVAIVQFKQNWTVLLSAKTKHNVQCTADTEYCSNSLKTYLCYFITRYTYTSSHFAYNLYRVLQKGWTDYTFSDFVDDFEQKIMNNIFRFHNF